MESILSMVRRYFVVWPIVYLFFSIFLLRNNIAYVYAVSLVLIAVVLLVQFKQKHKPIIFLAEWLLVLSAIGISSAVILSIEKVELLANPDHITSCAISPIVACSPVIASKQASAFGFANPFIGLFGFAAVFTAAMTIIAGATKLSRSWWRTLLGGIVFGAAFCSWLLYQGVFVIGRLCLYCMLVWLVTFAMLWLVLSYCIANKHINLGDRLNNILSYKYELIAFTYTAIFLLIFYKWSNYWLGLF